MPSEADLRRLALQKYGPISEIGWSPRRRIERGYFLPADVYEAFVDGSVAEGCRWLDVGGGQSLLPDNPGLTRSLAARCSTVAAVDPSDNVLANHWVHERHQCLIEEYHTDQRFDLITLRMVVEHIGAPQAAVAALNRLAAPGALVVVFTVNKWSPLTILSRCTPFRWHHPLKSILWGGNEEDTFPVCYLMNTRRVLKRLFENNGFTEAAFAYLDDLSTFGRFKAANSVELFAWGALHRLGIRYPENCLLAAYSKPVVGGSNSGE